MRWLPYIMALLIVSAIAVGGWATWYMTYNVCMPTGGKWCYATLEDAYRIPDGFCIVKFIGDEPVAERC